MKLLVLINDPISNYMYYDMFKYILRDFRFKGSRILCSKSRNRGFLQNIFFERLKVKQWDAIIIHDMFDYKELKKYLLDKNIVFASFSNNSRCIPFAFEQLSLVLNFCKNDKILFNIPKELVRDFSIPFNFDINDHSSQSIEPRVLYFCSERLTDNFSNILMLIQAINQIPHLSLAIFLNEMMPKSEEIHFKQLLNQSAVNPITFISDYAHVKNYRIAVTNGKSCLYFIANGFITLILGKNGFGGVINREKLELLQTYKFEGRPGGGLNEYIPIKLIVASVQSAFEITGSNKMFSIKIYKKTLDSYERVKKILYRDVSVYNSIKKKIEDDVEIFTLRPKLSLNIFFEHRGENFTVVSIPYSQHLGQIDIPTYNILQKMTGHLTLKVLAKQYPLLKGNIAFIKELWVRKIILFYL